MKITIEGTAKEIAELVLELQARQEMSAISEFLESLTDKSSVSDGWRTILCSENTLESK